jgi:hypothetical protein
MLSIEFNLKASSNCQFTYSEVLAEPLLRARLYVEAR